MKSSKVFGFLIFSYLLFHLVVSHPPKEAFWETPDFITNNGYPVETHTLIGLDGYYLTYFRIPHGKLSRIRGGEVVIMRHALGLSSRDWFTQEDPSKCLPFMLADAGYDVWVANARATRYSGGHVTLSRDDPEFWNWSYHEIGTYDLPAAVNYILRRTGKRQVSYIGHSMGCTSLIVFLNQNPEFNAVLRKIVFLAPATYLEHSASITKILKVFPSDKLLAFHNKIAAGRVFPPKITALLRKIGPKICSLKPGVSWKLCALITFLVVGSNWEGASEKTVQTVSGHLPEENSAKIIAHYAQWMGKPWMRQFDYGKKKNVIVYGSPEPPLYRMDVIQVPIMVMFSANDVLTEAEDTMRAILEMPYSRGFLVEDPHFNHLDFVYSWKAPELVYPHIKGSGNKYFDSMLAVEESQRTINMNFLKV